MTGPLLSVSDLRKSYTISAGLFKTAGVVRAVDGVDLEIGQNETLGLVGESGCGKSTLSRLILMLERPDSGSILFSGKDLLTAGGKELKAVRKNMQVIFQDPFGSLNPRKKVLSIIEEPVIVHSMLPKDEVRERALSLMEMVGLGRQMADRYPHEFSGGQRQRICIARALAINPRLVICDEPVSSLDVSVQAQVLNLLNDLKERMGLSYLFISHDLSVVGYLSDRVAVMYMGKIVEISYAAEIFERPLHPYTRCLLDAVPSIKKRGRRFVMKDAPRLALSGCDFYPRCPEAMECCREERPALEEISAGRRVSCFLYGSSLESSI